MFQTHMLLLCWVSLAQAFAFNDTTPFIISETLSSNMVLKQEPASPSVWGWGIPGLTVDIGTGTQVDHIVISSDGTFSYSLPPSPPGPYAGSGTIVFAREYGAYPNYSITLTNVLAGEVWMCSGQSNMGLSLAQTEYTSWDNVTSSAADEAILVNDYQDMRMITQASAGSSTLQTRASTGGGWFYPTADSIAGFSATCYFFGKKLHDQLKVPIGLIESQVGGTAVELWSSAEALQQCDQSRGPDRNMEATCGSKAWPSNASPHSSPFSDDSWKESLADDAESNSTLYNGMIHPWTPMTITGTIWYQGESNVACNDYWGYTQGNNCCMSDGECAVYYECQFGAMITDWRKKFNNEDMPFLFVELPSYVENLYQENVDGRIDESLPMLRQAQNTVETKDALAFKASVIDHGDIASPNGSIHPRDKRPVGNRLAFLALEHVYNLEGVAGSGGPGVVSGKVGEDVNSVELTFDDFDGSGLLLRTDDDGELRQKCVVGQQDGINAPPFPIPLSQCGPVPTGFEVTSLISDVGEWKQFQTIELLPDENGKLNVIKLGLGEKWHLGNGLLVVRYLYADWGVPTIYSAKSFEEIVDSGDGQLPVAPFEITINGNL